MDASPPRFLEGPALYDSTKNVQTRPSYVESTGTHQRHTVCSLGPTSAADGPHAVAWRQRVAHSLGSPCRTARTLSRFDKNELSLRGVPCTDTGRERPVNGHPSRPISRGEPACSQRRKTN